MNTRTNNRGNNKHGSKWIRQERRLAIYLRDGLSCVYCGSSIEEGTLLTLDHYIPRSKGGSHETRNLVTCCQKCNSSRGDRPVKGFIESVANYLDHGVTPEEIEKHVRNCRNRRIDTKTAKQMLDRRGGWTKMMNHLSGEEN